MQREHFMVGVDPNVVGHTLWPAWLLAMVASLVGAIPLILGSAASCVIIAFYAFQIWEGKTVRGYIEGRNKRKRDGRVAALQAEQARIIGELKQLGVLTHAETSISQGDGAKTVTTIESTPGSSLDKH